MAIPILVGVGQFAERIDDPDYRALSVVELGAEAARRCLNDALDAETLAPTIDVIAGVRQADAFNLSIANTPRLTVTGGLPFFGGAGNNYSMHAIATMAELLRENPGSFGFVGANGGFMSKYAVGIYSTTPVDFKPLDGHDLQAEIDALLSCPQDIYQSQC